MQNIYYISLEKDIKSINKIDIDMSYENAFDEMQDLLDQYIVDIGTRKHYHDVLYRLANEESQMLGHSALNQVFKGLMHLGYIARIERGHYLINDGFFKEYLQRI